MDRYLPLGPAVYSTTDDNYKASLVYIFAWAWIICNTAFIAVIVAFIPSYWHYGAETVTAINVSALVCLILNKQKRLRIASIFFPVSLWFIITLVTLTIRELYAPTIVAYLPIVITAGFLLEAFYGLLMTILCLLTALMFIVLEMNGVLVQKEIAPLILWLAFSVSGLLAGVMQFLITGRIQTFTLNLVKETDEVKLAEARLKESEFNNRMVVQNKVLGVVWVSPEGKIINVSVTFCQMLGYTEEELKGTPFNDLAYMDDVVSELELFNQLNPEVDSYSSEKRYRHKNGNYFWVELNLTCYRNAETGQPDFYVGIVQNIQHRRQVEDALKESEARYRTLVDNSVEALVVMDIEKGCFVSVSESAAQLFQMPAHELQKKNPLALSPEYQPNGRLSVDIFNELVHAVLAGKKPVFEWTFFDFENKPIWCEIRLVRLPSTTRFLIKGSIIDITERKTAETEVKLLNESLEKKVFERTRELEILNHDLTHFNSMLSHDLRGAIRRVIAFGEILARRLKTQNLNNETIEIIETIRKDGVKMDAIITGLLDMSKLGNKAIAVKDVNLNEIINTLITDFKKQWGHKASQIKIDSLPVIESDAIIVQQIFANLLSNAFKYSSKNDVIRINISCVIQEGYYLFAVTDNGVGFDMAHHDKVFKGFVRLHHEEDFEGTGIGLNSVKRFVEKLGGRIWAESALFEGSTFYVALPLQPVAHQKVHAI